MKLNNFTKEQMHFFNLGLEEKKQFVKKWEYSDELRNFFNLSQYCNYDWIPLNEIENENKS